MIEEDEQVRQSSSSDFERLGVNVLLAADGDQASQIWKNNEFLIDVLVVDLQGPRITGSEIAIQFRKNRPQLKVVFTVRNNPKVLLETSRLVRGAKFVKRPFNVQDLVNTVVAECNHS